MSRSVDVRRIVSLAMATATPYTPRAAAVVATQLPSGVWVTLCSHCASRPTFDRSASARHAAIGHQAAHAAGRIDGWDDPDAQPMKPLL